MYDDEMTELEDRILGLAAEIGELEAELAFANNRAETLQHQRDEMAAVADKAGKALELLYSRWETGDPCFEGGDIDGSPMGNAVQLSGAEERQCLEAMEAVGIETVLRKQAGERLTPSAILAARDKAQRQAGAVVGLPCERAGTHAPECKDIDEEMFGLCPRCQALAALKGGRG